MSEVSPARIQSYFREVARKTYETVLCPPFTIFFHPTDPLVHFNYAIPDEPVSGDLAEPLDRLVDAFTKRGRTPRFELVEAFAPGLGASLAARGFQEEGRPFLMCCLPATARPVAPPEGITLQKLTDESPDDDIRSLLSVARRAFGMSDGPVSDADLAWNRKALGAAPAFLARQDGLPVAAANLLAPIGGLAEVAGVATLESHRRRGIGAALTSAAVTEGFSRGVDAVVLSAADERAGRVYRSVGFEPYGFVLACSSPSPS